MENYSEIISKTAEETSKLGEQYGNHLRGGEVVALSGDLGAGKTTFVQGLVKSLGINQRITSPTFVLLREYKNRFGGYLYHVDLYRLEKATENDLESLGIVDFSRNRKNIILIEWAEKAKDYLPKSTKWVKFEYVNENTRRILI